jgi:uncharacterized RDD family membrane protein YckC
MAGISDPPTSATLGLDLRIETPENVVLTYQLAGPAARLGAYLLDLCVRLLIWGIGLMLMAAMSLSLPGLGFGTFLVVWFLAEWAYYVVLEWGFSGKSIGKAALGLRVIHERGHPITLWSAMLRNLLRAADGLPLVIVPLNPVFRLELPVYGVGLLSMALSGRFQRLGDLAAGTVVISERHVVLPREPIIIEKIDPLPRADLGRTPPDDRTLSLIEEFLSRRSILTHERGHAMCAPLARVLAERLGYRGDAQLVERYPMAFLARVYVTFLRRDEQEPEDDGGWLPPAHSPPPVSQVRPARRPPAEVLRSRGRR